MYHPQLLYKRKYGSFQLTHVDEMMVINKVSRGEPAQRERSNLPQMKTKEGIQCALEGE